MQLQDLEAGLSPAIVFSDLNGLIGNVFIVWLRTENPQPKCNG